MVRGEEGKSVIVQVKIEFDYFVAEAVMSRAQEKTVADSKIGASVKTQSS